MCDVPDVHGSTVYPAHNAIHMKTFRLPSRECQYHSLCMLRHFLTW